METTIFLTAKQAMLYGTMLLAKPSCDKLSKSKHASSMHVEVCIWHFQSSIKLSLGFFLIFSWILKDQYYKKFQFDKLHYGSSGIRDDSKLGLFFPRRCTVKMKMHHSWGNESGINQLSSSDIITAICLSSTLILKWALFLTAMHYVGGHSTDFIIHSYGVTARWCKQVLYSSLSSDKELCRLHIFLS